MNEVDVSVRATFERFPATVKGAFVFRGEGPNPHQVAFKQAAVVKVGGGDGMSIPVKPAVIDCPPHQDMFLPFEFSTTDLAPGWYELEAEVEVDADPRTMPGGRRFTVGWPRATVRRGPITADVRLDLGEGKVSITQIDCSGDNAVVSYVTEPASFAVELRVAADGERLGHLEDGFDPETGKGWAKVYPILRSSGKISLHALTRGASATEEIPLP